MPRHGRGDTGCHTHHTHRQAGASPIPAALIGMVLPPDHPEKGRQRKDHHHQPTVDGQRPVQRQGRAIASHDALQVLRQVPGFMFI